MKSDIEHTTNESSSKGPIELKVEYKRLNSFFADYSKNISRGGTFIRTTRPLPVGTDFVFTLSIPGLDHPLQLLGRVQWVVAAAQATQDQAAGMGIGFIFESEADRQRIEGLVEALMVESLGSPLFHKLMGRAHQQG